MHKFHLNQNYEWHGIFVIKLNNTVLHFGGILSYSFNSGIKCRVMYEEFNSDLNELNNYELINECEAYLEDLDSNEIIRCKLLNVMLGTKFNSMKETFGSLTLMPEFIVFNSSILNKNINSIDIHIPIWNEFILPQNKQYYSKYIPERNIIDINEYIKIVFSECASFTIANKEELKNILMNDENAVIETLGSEYIKVKQSHDRYISIRFNKESTLDISQLNDIKLNVYKIISLIEIILNRKVGVSTVNINCENIKVNILYTNTYNKIKNYKKFINLFEPITYDKVPNINEIIQLYFEKYFEIRELIDIMNLNRDESYNDFHFTRIADCLKEISKTKKKSYDSAILENSNDTILDEIQELFSREFKINKWDEIGKRISLLRAKFTHFNEDGVSDISQSRLYLIYYNLTVLFTIIINSYILKEIGFSKELIDKYQNHHFKNRSIAVINNKDNN